MNPKLKELLASRKLWASLVGAGAVFASAYLPDFPLSENQVTEFVYVVVAYVIGTGVESGLQARR